MGIGKEEVFVSHVNPMASFMALENAKHLTEVVFNKHFRGLIVNKVRK